MSTYGNPLSRRLDSILSDSLVEEESVRLSRPASYIIGSLDRARLHPERQSPYLTSRPDRSAPGPSLPESSNRSHYDVAAISQPLLPTLSRLDGDSTSPSDRQTYPDHVGYPNEPQSATTGTSSSSAHSSPQFWSPSPTDRSTSKTRKRRKPRIDLAPDQPPTTQGKQRARVYVACVQCRTRKIRCDGARPICFNCGRRGASTDRESCTYDDAPKRRGPDKVAGARQRMVREDAQNIIVPVRRRRRAQAKPAEPSTPPQTSQVPSIPQLSHSAIRKTLKELPPLTPIRPKDVSCTARSDLQESGGFSGMQIHPPYGSSCDVMHARTYIMESREDTHDKEPEKQELLFATLPLQPSLDFSRRTWWDSLLILYTLCNSRQPPPFDSSQSFTLTNAQRTTASRGVALDTQWILRASNYWFAFFHIPTFWGFLNPAKREQVQPSLVLAVLAVSTFFQSSDLGRGQPGREAALKFGNEARASLEAAFNAGWIDDQLAQAAWLLALFEVCAHPLHSTARSSSAMLLLDNIIRNLALVTVDVGNPAATVFSQRSVAVVVEDPDSTSIDSRTGVNFGSSSSECSCISLTLAHNWPEVAEHAPMVSLDWSQTPAWKMSWSAAEIRRESCRRLVWSSMSLAAGHISYTALTKNQNGMDLFISNPANYAILFSGEAIHPNNHRKDTVWALSDRSYLLWHSCQRMRSDPFATPEEMARFGAEAWLEADKIERALDSHTCQIEKTFIYVSRDYLFNTRMYVYYEFRQYMGQYSLSNTILQQIGLFTSVKAQAWLSHSKAVAKRFMQLHTITGNKSNMLAQRPFFVFWFMSQISRALLLWKLDNSMILALEVASALCLPVEYLSNLWPCPEQRSRYRAIKQNLKNECARAGVAPPPDGPLF